MVSAVFVLDFFTGIETNHREKEAIGFALELASPSGTQDSNGFIQLILQQMPCQEKAITHSLLSFNLEASEIPSDSLAERDIWDQRYSLANGFVQLNFT